MRLLEGLDHLLQTSDLCIDDVIRQNHRERLIADQFLGHQHSMAQAERLGLPHTGEATNLPSSTPPVPRQNYDLPRNQSDGRVAGFACLSVSNWLSCCAC